ncbi:MAG TPA: hypothetical protein PKE32_08060 [Miltoncostaeaceae bacterium]|nr:hypothetical protein [Miltoncostaeaceae bacterium]
MGRRRSAPRGPKALVIAIVLSVLLPGLGHVYLGYLPRAIIWFVGMVLLALVIGGEAENAWLGWVMGGAIGACAAADVIVLRCAG